MVDCCDLSGQQGIQMNNLYNLGSCSVLSFQQNREHLVLDEGRKENNYEVLTKEHVCSLGRKE